MLNVATILAAHLGGGVVSGAGAASRPAGPGLAAANGAPVRTAQALRADGRRHDGRHA